MPGKYSASPKKTAKGWLSWIFSSLLAICGICIASLAIWLCLEFADEAPILLSPPEEATQQVTDLMDAVCRGDYEAAGNAILGSPDLGIDRDPADALGQLFWAELVESMDYTLEGSCYTTQNGLAQDVTFTYLDLSSVTASLRERSQAMLEERVQQAEDTSEIYDENNEYREDFVMEVLLDAAEEALREDAHLVTVELTVNMKYQNGAWQIVADKSLLDAITGGILF